MEQIGNLIRSKTFKKLSRYSTPWQVRGGEICRLISSRRFGRVIQLVKNYPRQTETALQFVIDYPNAKSKEKIFFWRVHQLIRSCKEK